MSSKNMSAHPSRLPSGTKLSSADLKDYHVVLTTYGALTRNDRIREHSWRHVILDEAQAIKNPGSRQTRAVKAPEATWRLALTGTPIENRLGGPLVALRLPEPGAVGLSAGFQPPVQVQGLGGDGVRSAPEADSALHPASPEDRQSRHLRPARQDRAGRLLPPDQTAAALYQQSVEELAKTLETLERRGVVLKYLLRLKQICNHPSHWLGDGAYDPDGSGKMARLREVCEPIAERQEKVLVFTQFREITEPLAAFLAEVFGRAGLVLHGGTPVAKRQGLVRRFQDDERVPFMVLSLKAGGTGLNLTAASHVIPELLYMLRGVDPSEMIEAAVLGAPGPGSGRELECDDLAAMFGIDLAESVPAGGSGRRARGGAPGAAGRAPSGEPARASGRGTTSATRKSPTLEQQALAAAKREGRIATGTVMERFGLPRIEARSLLQKLAQRGKLRQVGERGPAVHYVPA